MITINRKDKKMLRKEKSKCKHTSCNVITPIELEEQIKNKLEFEKKKNEELTPYFNNFFSKMFSGRYDEYFDLAEKYKIPFIFIHIHDVWYGHNNLTLMITIEENKYTVIISDRLTQSIKRIHLNKGIQNYNLNVQGIYNKKDNTFHLDNESIMKNDSSAILIWRHVQERLAKIDEDEFWNKTFIENLSESILNEVEYQKEK